MASSGRGGAPLDWCTSTTCVPFRPSVARSQPLTQSWLKSPFWIRLGGSAASAVVASVGVSTTPTMVERGVIVATGVGEASRSAAGVAGSGVAGGDVAGAVGGSVAVATAATPDAPAGIVTTAAVAR